MGSPLELGRATRHVGRKSRVVGRKGANRATTGHAASTRISWFLRVRDTNSAACPILVTVMRRPWHHAPMAPGYWLRGESPQNGEPLADAVRADVAVIGAGF